MDLVVAMSAFVDEEAMAQTYEQIKPHLEVWLTDIRFQTMLCKFHMELKLMFVSVAACSE